MTEHKNVAQQVREFQEAMGSPLDEEMSLHSVGLNQRLIAEEASEFFAEVERATVRLSGRKTPTNKEHLLKELADLVYTCYHFANTHGLPLDEAIAMVHVSNMSKLDDEGKPIRRADGKVLKGKNYKPADLRPLVLMHV